MHELPISTRSNAQGICAWGLKYSMHEYSVNSLQVLRWACMQVVAAGAAVVPLPGTQPAVKLVKTPKMPKASPIKKPQYPSSDTLEKEQQLQAVETRGRRDGWEDLGLETCFWKEALHVQGAHPKGSPSGRLISIFNFFTSAELSETSHLETGVKVV